MVMLHSLKKLRTFTLRHPSPSFLSLQTLKSLCTTTTAASQNDSNTNLTVDYLINSCGLTPEGAASASKWVHLQHPERADSVLAHLRSHGFSATQVSRVVRSNPKILISNFDKTVLPKLQYFTSLGVEPDELVKVVASNPLLLGKSLENCIIPTYKLLMNLLPSKSVGYVLKRGSRIFLANCGTSVVPNMELLRKEGMPQSSMAYLLLYMSWFVTLKHDSFAKLLVGAKEMGFNMRNSTSLSAMHVLGCKNVFVRSHKVFKETWGWSEEDFMCAFRKNPRSMLLSEKKIVQVMEFLVNKMGWTAVKVAKNSNILCYSLEKRTIPRFTVFKVLLSKGLVSEDSNVLYPLRMVEGEFLKRFVTKYVDLIPQLMSVYQGKVDMNDVIDTSKTESL